MEEKAIRGIPWTILSYVGAKGVTMVSTLVLARLLVPDDYGVAALALTVVGALTLLSDFGLGNALIVRQDLSPRGEGTVFTLMLLTGLAFAVVGIALSGPMANVFDEPKLASVMPVLAITLALYGIVSFHEKLMQREFEFRRTFAATMAHSVSYAIVAVTLGALGAGVWALVLSQVVGMTAYGVAAVALAPYRVRPAFDPATARVVLRTGGGFVMQGGFSFAQENADNLVIGRALGAGSLGLYNMGYRLGEIPYLAISDPVSRVGFASGAKQLSRGEDVFPSFLSTLRMIALVACPLGILLSACSAPFVEAVLGDKWLPMIGVLGVLGIWAAVKPVQNATAWGLNAAGRQAELGIQSALLLVPAVPALIAAATFGGIEAVAGVVLARTLLQLGLALWTARRRAGFSLARIWTTLRPMVLACAGAWPVARVVADAGDGTPSSVALMASAVAGLVAYAGLMSMLEPGSLPRAARQAGRMMGRSPATGVGSA